RKPAARRRGQRGRAISSAYSTLAEIIAIEGLQRVVERIDDRLAGRDFEAGDLVVRNGREMLDQGPQRIAVRRDQHAPALAQGGRDPLLPAGQDAPDRVLEALPGRNGDAGIAAVAR